LQQELRMQQERTEEGSPQELRTTDQGCEWKNLQLVPTPQSMVHSQAQPVLHMNASEKHGHKYRKWGTDRQ